MKKINNKEYIWAAISALAVGIVIALLNPGDSPIIGFFSGFFFFFSSTIVLLIFWKKIAGSKQAGWAAAVSFIIRIVIGIILFITLPVFGYDEVPPNNGYLYLDAYERDMDAWRLAQSGESLASAFQNEFYSDQYGGLLSLSAGIYRLFSPDNHRPLLILILTSFLYSLGLPFFWGTVNDLWGKRMADISVWILALYPESIILGASQMREPILIGLSAIGFWAINRYSNQNQKGLSLLTIGFCLFALFFISLKAAAAILVSLVLFFWIDYFLPESGKRVRAISYVLILILLAVGLFAGWGWLVDSSKWDLLLMEGSSGRIQWELELIGKKYQAPFIISYGFLQPVLPAAIIYPGIAVTKTIAIFRAAGWYALLPSFLTAIILVWKAKPKRVKYRVILFLVLILAWTLISSARAGGDQWDNPRYRTIFLMWYALLTSWTWLETKSRGSRWLHRIIFLEITYSGFFMHWYLSRYFGLFKRMDFWPMIRLLVSIGVITVIGGFILDLLRRKKQQQNPKP